VAKTTESESPPAMVLPITVGEIAEALQPIHVPTVIERLRYWTREGLLPSLEMGKRGVGRHVVYHPDVAFDAYVLNALADMGVAVATKRHVITDALAAARNARKEWERTNAKGPFRLAISLYASKGGRIEVKAFEGRVVDDPLATVTFIVNISQIQDHFAQRAARGSPVTRVVTAHGGETPQRKTRR
jgi:hypothetical protein